jgi:short-subunit dehydrogenase
MTLTQHRVLITGASSGIGHSTALAFAESGAEVALVSRSLPKLEAVAQEIADKTGKAAALYPLDLSIVAEVKAAIAAITAQFQPTILVNNAGMGYTGDLLTTSLEDWQQVIDLNLTSPFQCIQAVLPSMRDRRQGLIINVTSIAGHQAFPGWGAYSVSKAGLISLSKVLAAEERKHGIRVVNICPGSVNTPIWDTATVQADFDRSHMLPPEAIAQSILHAALLPSQAVIEELIVMPSAGAL